MNAVVRRINELRTKKGISQNELANLIGVSANAVYHWNKRGAMPSLANVEKICEVMGISVEQFFCGIDDVNDISEDSKFLHEWQVLNEQEKDAILKVIEVFKSLRQGNESNDKCCKQN